MTKPTTPATKKPKRAKSTVRHTRAVARDRTKHPISAPPAEALVARLEEIVHPATLQQVRYFYDLGLRERILTLPVMVGLVLGMLWRQLGSVSELTRLVQTELVLWVPPLPKLTQQALANRLQTLPAELFQRVLAAVLPVMHERWHARHRPLPPEVAWAQAHYRRFLIADGSTLDALLRKLKLLADGTKVSLGGRMLALLDGTTRLPIQVWFESNPTTHDQRFWAPVQAVLCAGDLLLIDLGFTNFGVFAQLTASGVIFITRAKTNLAFTVTNKWVTGTGVRDWQVTVGTGDSTQTLRLIQVRYRGKWYRYLTNELHTPNLPTAYVVALYWQRWRIEDAYALVKRLLGLAYLWCGTDNAIQLQLWATWLLYAVLLDLSDATADRLHQPLAAVSVEMTYRSLYFATQALHRGETNDPVAYLADHSRQLGILKQPRKSRPQVAPLEFVANLLHEPLTNL
jgi:hypothetical protein